MEKATRKKVTRMSHAEVERVKASILAVTGASTNPMTILGDSDQAGQVIIGNVERKLRLYAPMVDFTFVHLAVTEQQIRDVSLPRRPGKVAGDDPRGVVELDAIPADTLVTMVENAILSHLAPNHIEAVDALTEEGADEIEAMAVAKESEAEAADGLNTYSGDDDL